MSCEILSLYILHRAGAKFDAMLRNKPTRIPLTTEDLEKEFLPRLQELRSSKQQGLIQNETFMHILMSNPCS